jgi:hypothetical protein
MKRYDMDGAVKLADGRLLPLRCLWAGGRGGDQPALRSIFALLPRLLLVVDDGSDKMRALCGILAFPTVRLSDAGRSWESRGAGFPFRPRCPQGGAGADGRSGAGNVLALG